MELRAQSRDWPSWTLTPRQLCDLELLLNGGFAPLRGFLSRRDYACVCRDMRLSDGALWPIPIVLAVTERTVAGLGPSRVLALRDPEGVLLAALRVEDAWQPDLAEEARRVYGTTSLEHPGVAALVAAPRAWYVGGRIEGIRLPTHYDFPGLRHTPAELRVAFASLGWSRVVAFQTRNPMHRAHMELTLRAARRADANVLLHPVVGPTMPGDIAPHTRVRCYQAILPRYPQGVALLSLLPLAMRMAGPREALWHAIVRRNHGCTHFIVGRDHASPGGDQSGQPFYGPDEARELVCRHQDELGMQVVPFATLAYLKEEDRYVAEDEIPPGARVQSLSGTELRKRLAMGRSVPRWFSFPEVVKELRRGCPKPRRRGFCVFLTGLPSSGKSTVAKALYGRLMERDSRPVTLLDGDLVRQHLSSELGFSKKHRDLNIRRIGFVASEITKNGGAVICAAIAPFGAARQEARRMVEPRGRFLLVYIATPLDVCEQRDPKGHYAKARAGAIDHFTGISDPYEAPADADVTLDTASASAQECADRILAVLEEEGYVARGDGNKP